MSVAALQEDILQFVAQQLGAGAVGVPAGQIQVHTARPRATVNRALARLVASGRLEPHGAGRALRYRIPAMRTISAVEHPIAFASQVREPAFPWGGQARELAAHLQAPLARRKPVSYQRGFVERYQPNISSLLPQVLAQELQDKGRTRGQMPAGTYARKVLEQLLIDLSWCSSRLEGNRKTLLDTRELFARGRSPTDDPDAIMLLNHKDAIEFMVDAVPTEGITLPVVRNLQSLLMRDLLTDPAELGAIRNRIVHIQDSVYVPSQVPNLLQEMLTQIVDKATQIRNPVEAAFFCWVNIAYLQPFVDGNKRTSRLAANMPLMLANCAPLSFLEVEQGDYALAMLGVYERLDLTLAIELFDQTYRRSIDKYRVVAEAMGGPDPLRLRYREQLGQAIQQIVYFSVPAEQAISAASVAAEDMDKFRSMLAAELAHLEPYNCARFRLPIASTERWIAKGRPS